MDAAFGQSRGGCFGQWRHGMFRSCLRCPIIPSEIVCLILPEALEMGRAAEQEFQKFEASGEDPQRSRRRERGDLRIGCVWLTTGTSANQTTVFPWTTLVNDSPMRSHFRITTAATYWSTAANWEAVFVLCHDRRPIFNQIREPSKFRVIWVLDELEREAERATFTKTISSGNFIRPAQDLGRVVAHSTELGIKNFLSLRTHGRRAFSLSNCSRCFQLVT